MKIDLPAGSALRSPDFLFGVATSSYQIEGAADSRLPCIWDTFCDEPGRIADGSNGRVACDHVRFWREDVALMADLGVDAYRFSISWPRVLTEKGALNPDGVGFYRDLVEGLLKVGIKPFVTLYHWDLPQYLEDKGGWLDRDTAYRFRDYAALISEALGPGVHSWATLNEPFCSSVMAYELGVHAPGFRDPGMARQAAHHLLLAHGLAMPVLQENCPAALNGIVLNLVPCHPASDSEADREAAGLADQALNQWFAQPLLAGGYPDLLERLPGDERPDIHSGDFEIIRQPLDFLGVNYYTRCLVRAADESLFDILEPEGEPLTEMGWEIFPQGLVEVLDMLDQNYANLPTLFITENGAAMKDKVAEGRIDDPDRVRYFAAHLRALDRAMKAGADVRGYFAWSLMDNFEWSHGYEKRFGLVHVDYETGKRTLKSSGRAYRDMLNNRKTKGNA